VTDISSVIKLNNGLLMPRLGLGTWRLSGREVIEPVVKAAFEAGYRRIDTATAYENEADLGAALKEVAWPRDELFITSKVWNSDQGRDKTVQACHRSLELLGLSYLDLYLVHWPVAQKSLEAWEDLEKLLADGYVKAIGVSNFQKNHLDEILKLGGTKPVVNQVELHPYQNQEHLSEYCGRQGVTIEAYCPLARGQLKKNQFLIKLSRKHSRSIAQIVLRWHFQSGRAFSPKSSNPSRIQENSEIYDFVLSPEEMAAINRQNQNRSVLKPKFEFNEDGWIVEND
jgi:diketogulonate reductase-like aldo/keto reductase